jgi:hypothetical protein
MAARVWRTVACFAGFRAKTMAGRLLGGCCSLPYRPPIRSGLILQRDFRPGQMVNDLDLGKADL